MKLLKKVKSFIAPLKGGHEPDRTFMITIGILVVFGLMMLSSASAVVSYAEFGSSYYYFTHQLIGLFVGIFAFWFLSKVDYHVWRKYAIFFLLASIGVLTLVFIPGLSAEHGTSQSWITLGGFSLQPSELVKVFFLIYLAAWLERRGGYLEKVGEGIGPFLIILGIIALLMLLQPDLGTLFIIAASSLMVYFVGGGKIFHLVVLSIFGILIFTLLLNLYSYQMDRVQCWQDPQMGHREECYQVNQSMIAVGSGGLLGKGIGQSKQKYMYLPEVISDSIFAVIAEEIGFIFSSLVIFLYILLFYRGVAIAKKAPDIFGKLLTFGVVSWMMIQVILNIGGMINLIPMTGVPLPLVSYGGSAMVATLAGLGIVVNISKQTRTNY